MNYENLILTTSFDLIQKKMFKDRWENSSVQSLTNFLRV